MEKRVELAIDSKKDRILELSQFLYENPEIGLQEHKSAKRFAEMLREEGFEVEENLEGMETAIVGRKKNGKGPKIAFIAEYDALPEIGHACGHHLISAMSFGAALGLSAVLDEFEGEILLVGTPAEEIGEGKPYLIEKGFFDDIDVAMMIHPSGRTCLSPEVLAIAGIDFNFYGKASHASSAPYMGVNALDAVILLFNNINALRQQLRGDARVHGIIIQAGEVANSIPEKSKVRLEMRAGDQEYFLSLIEKVKNCARAAELATGTRLEWNHFEPNCDSLKTNDTIINLFKDQMNKFDLVVEEYPLIGSTDMGNLSQVVPSIHPFLNMIEEDAGLHTKDFLEKSGTQFAKDKTIVGAKLLALTGLELLKNPEKLAEAKREFNNSRVI